MPTTPETIRVRGPRPVIEDLQAELASRGTADIELQCLRPNLLSRQPLGQVEFADLVISFVVGVASNATYDWIKGRMDELAASGHVEIIELGLSKEPKNTTSADQRP